MVELKSPAHAALSALRLGEGSGRTTLAFRDKFLNKIVGRGAALMDIQILEKARWLDFPSDRPIGKLVFAEMSAFCDSDWTRTDFSDAVGKLAIPSSLYAGLVIDQIALSKKNKDKLVEESSLGILDVFKSLDDYLKHPELKSLLEAQDEIENINNNLNASDFSIRLSEIHKIQNNAAVAIAQRTLNDADSTMGERELASDLIAQPDISSTIKEYATHWINKKRAERLNNSIERARTQLARWDMDASNLRGIAPEDGFSFLEKISADSLVALSIGSPRSKFFTEDDFRFIEVLSGLRYLALDNTLITDKSLVYLRKMTQISSLSLSQTRVSGAGLLHIKELSGLTRLNLYGTNVTDDSLLCLQGLTQLQELNLRYTGITDAGLMHLQKLPSLRKLYIGGTQIFDGGLRHISGMKKLTDIGLSGTQITDAGLAHLAEASGIEKLNLWNTKISDAGVEHLARMKGLTGLSLANTQITDNALIHLSKMRKLQQLDLSDTLVTDSSLWYLHQLPSLRKLDLDKTSVTSSGLACFQESSSNVALGFADVTF